MVRQYPHSLYVHVVGDSTQDGDGNWSEPLENWSLHSVCREETNGKGNIIRTPDGQSIVFSSTIYMPSTALKIQEGAEVQVRDSEDATRIQGRVLKFDVGQINRRLWL